MCINGPEKFAQSTFPRDRHFSACLNTLNRPHTECLNHCPQLTISQMIRLKLPISWRSFSATLTHCIHFEKAMVELNGVSFGSSPFNEGGALIGPCSMKKPILAHRFTRCLANVQRWLASSNHYLNLQCDGHGKRI